MTAICIFNGVFCEVDSVVSDILDISGFRPVSDQDIVGDAARLSGLDASIFVGLFRDEPRDGAVSSLDHERLVCWLRLAVAERISGGENLVIYGYSALLVPREVENILHVCLVSDLPDRLRAAARESGYTEDAARECIRRDDLSRADWAATIADATDPWARELYDLVIPVGSLGVGQSAFLIVKQLAKAVLQDSDTARRAMGDFLLAARTYAALSENWHGLSVYAREGVLSVRLSSHAAVLKSLGRHLCRFVSGMSGVKGVEMGVGRGYSQGDIYTRAGRRSAATSGAGQGQGKTELAGCSVGHPADYELAGRVEAALSLQGYPVSVFAKDGAVSLTVNDHKGMLQVVARVLCRSLADMDGVSNVEVGVGTGYHQPALYDKVRRETARRRIADEGRQFVLSRSLRLQAPVRSFAVYDENAWSPEREKEVEVLVLNVNMPGLNDIEVLRRIKRERPDMDVLILADRESEADRAACLDLGAFAYLPKPVNIGIFSRTIRSVSEKNRCCSP
ncbi:MAG: cytidylate kinase family protein [Pseudodesulfovibrio sp.]